MTPPDPKPASDAEIAHGRITLDEMYACKDDCPALHGGRCFRCSIHPAILVRIDSDRAENDRLRARVAELEARNEILRKHKCLNCGSFTVSVFAEPEPARGSEKP